MNEDLISALNNSINQKQELTELEKKEKERLRSINSERVRRYRHRKKLKDAVAEFINRLNLYTVNHVDKTTMNVINVSLRNILDLRPHWTEKDLHLAFNSLHNLEIKYLGYAKTKIPDEKFKLQTKLTGQILQANISNEKRLEVALNVLNDVARSIISKGEGLAPSRANTIALLTQDLSNGVPEWFSDAAINLLAEKYTGDDLFHLLTKLRKTLNKKKIIEGSMEEADE